MASARRSWPSSTPTATRRSIRSSGECAPRIRRRLPGDYADLARQIGLSEGDSADRPAAVAGGARVAGAPSRMAADPRQRPSMPRTAAPSTFRPETAGHVIVTSRDPL